MGGKVGQSRSRSHSLSMFVLQSPVAPVVIVDSYMHVLL